MSKSPPMPSVLLIRNRPSSTLNPFRFHWSRLFASFGTTVMLSKPLPIICWKRSGMTKL
jgi:hypothetical protein